MIIASSSHLASALNKVLELSSVANFRPLAGNHPSSSLKGLYRSGSLSKATPADVLKLRFRHGIRWVIDLRTDEELAKGPLPKVLTAFFECHSMPLSSDATILSAYPTSTDYLNYYKQILSSQRRQIKAIVALIHEKLPAAGIVCCHAGKDRTGIIAALLQDQAHFPVEFIATEYGISSVLLTKKIWLFQANWEKRSQSREEYAVRLKADPKIVMELLKGYSPGEFCRKYLADEPLPVLHSDAALPRALE